MIISEVSADAPFKLTCADSIDNPELSRACSIAANGGPRAHQRTPAFGRFEQVALRWDDIADECRRSVERLQIVQV
jgi:hypothetical protein